MLRISYEENRAMTDIQRIPVSLAEAPKLLRLIAEQQNAGYTLGKYAEEKAMNIRTCHWNDKQTAREKTTPQETPGLQI